MIRHAALALSALLASQLAPAGGLDVTVEIPRLHVLEYYRPYVAVWLETDEGRVINLAAWYNVRQRDRKGEKWLKDIRQWWRLSGRSQQFPIDGVTAATRAPGVHRLTFRSGQSPLGDLDAGQYTLRVEAAREEGGRELVEIPFTWPVREQQVLTVSGESELGKIVLTVFP